MKKIFLLVITGVLFYGCKIGTGFSHSINTQAKDIGKNIIVGVDSGLLKSTLRSDLYRTIDSAIAVAGISADKNLKVILDSVFTQRWSILIKQLVEDASGKQLHKNIEDIRETLVGVKTRQQLQDLFQSVLNDQTDNRLISLKNELIGQQTAILLSAIVDTAMIHLTSQFHSGIADPTLLKLSKFLNTDLRKGIDTNLSVIQKYATWFLAGIAAVAIIIVTIIWHNRQKYLKLSTLLAAHVNAIPDKNTYDQLTARIKQSAATTGVEPALRNIIEKNKLLGATSWKPIS